MHTIVREAQQVKRSVRVFLQYFAENVGYFLHHAFSAKVNIVLYLHNKYIT